MKLISEKMPHVYSVTFNMLANHNVPLPQAGLSEVLGYFMVV